jgi:aspartyl protease family protein
MFQRYAALAVFLAVLFIGVGSFAGKSAGEAMIAAEAASAEDSGPWFRDEPRRRSSIPAGGSSSEVQLDRDSDTHFYATTRINGTDVRMMVDSGASMIALTRTDAEAIGINVDDLPIGGNAATAGGIVPIRPVELDRVAIAGIEVSGVQAAVIDADMPYSLLGQSFLSRLQSVKVEGDRMTLR